MKRAFARLFKNESGATAIEYALIAAGVAVVIVGAVNGLGIKLNATYAGVLTALN